MATVDRTKILQKDASHTSSAVAALDVTASWGPAASQYVGQPVSDREIAANAGAKVVDQYPDALRRLAE